jgi:hypothetical protein
VLDATHARGFDMGGNPIVSVAACPAPERMFWSMDAVAVRETPIVLSFIPIGCGQPIRRPGPGCRARQARVAHLDDDAGIAERGASSSG